MSGGVLLLAEPNASHLFTGQPVLISGAQPQNGTALDLLWSARKFNGEEAKSLGLAERLVEDGESKEAAQAYIRELAASAAPVSMRVMKAQVYRHMNAELGAAMQETNDWMASSLKRDDFKEGVRSFIEKRPPNFERVKG
mgnify:CR=1 FL=1